MKRFLFLVSFFLTLEFVHAQVPIIKTSVDKKGILIGEQLKYNVQASFPVNTYTLTWLEVPDSFSHFEVVSRGKIDTIESKGLLIFRQTITLTSFDSGIFAIPALPLTFDPATGDSALQLSTDSIPINISYSPLDSTKTFHDIKTIIDVKDEIPWWWWAAGAAILILLIVLIIYLVKYFKRPKKPARLFDSKLSPLDEAMKSLDSLQSEQLLYKGEVKQFHTRLSEIFKRYFSRKMEKNMLNLTSSEMLIAVNDTLLSKSDTTMLAGTLRMADAVKFAKFYPHKEESETSLNETRKVIEQIDKLIFDQQKLNPTN